MAFFASSCTAFAPLGAASRLPAAGDTQCRMPVVVMQQQRTKKKQIRVRTPVPPPPAGTPSAGATFRRWAAIQFASDAVSVTILSLLVQQTPLELFQQGSVLLWVLGGPALLTFGYVYKLITVRDEAPDFDTDFVVLKLGGPNAVRGLRYEISEALRF